MTDWVLLQQYLQRKSGEAFAQLVHRHIAWVRSAAHRQVRDAHLADDVTQAVFLALAQQAHRLHEGVALSTWLFQVTRYASHTALRAKSRRERHERQAAMTAQSHDNLQAHEQWELVSPILDTLVARLRSQDQRAILLRFYEQKSYPEIAAALGVTEEAARKRTDRAVEKLRQLVGNRAPDVSAAALSMSLLTYTTTPASPTLAADAVAVALRGESAATTILTLSKGAIRMLTFAKLRLPVAACLAVLLIAAAVTLLNAGPQSVAATQAASQPAAAERSPKAVVIAAFRAAVAGDADGLTNSFASVTPAQADTLKEVAQLMSATDAVTKSVSQQFGAEIAQQFSRTIGVGVGVADVNEAVETINEGSATVDIGSGPGKIPLIQSGNTWKISPRVLRTLNPNMVHTFAAKLPAMKQLSDEIRAGKYKTDGELRQAISKVMVSESK